MSFLQEDKVKAQAVLPTTINHRKDILSINLRQLLTQIVFCFDLKNTFIFVYQMLFKIETKDGNIVRLSYYSVKQIDTDNN